MSTVRQFVADVPPNVSILGSRVDLVGLQDTLSAMDHWITAERHRCHHIVVTGFHGLWEAHRDPEFRRVLNSSDLWVPDGIAPVWIARLRGYRDVQRTPGAEVMKGFLELANTRGYRSFFYGDTKETLEKMRSTLDGQYPGHEIVGMISPPFRSLSFEEDREIIETINDARPDVLWVGLGLPKQERWIAEHRYRLQVPVAVGVGAAFGFTAGTVQRCPEWIGDRGFEWAYRFLKEPKKLWRRDLLLGPRFILHVLLECARLKRYD